MIPKITHAQLVKWCQLLAAATELSPDQAYYETGMHCIDWQRRVILHTLKAGRQHAIQATLEPEADTISWAIFDHAVLLDSHWSDDDGEDYAPMTREEYARMVHVIATLAPEKEAYLIQLNAPENNRAALLHWFRADQTEEAGAPSLAEAVAGTGIIPTA